MADAEGEKERNEFRVFFCPIPSLTVLGDKLPELLNEKRSEPDGDNNLLCRKGITHVVKDVDGKIHAQCQMTSEVDEKSVGDGRWLTEATNGTRNVYSTRQDAGQSLIYVGLYPSFAR